MGTIDSQDTSLTIVYSTIYSGADQRKHQSSASLAFVQGRWPLDSKCFHLWMSSWANCQLCGNVSLILLLYKTWGYHNKFESLKSFRVCYWYVKMPWCGCVEHGLEYITFYVEKTYSCFSSVFWFPSVSRRVNRGGCICETCLFKCRHSC